ncbi:HTH_Tnp_Tc3_2 domain-containing protein [Trichonephila clavipes]|nr:HTH_Tnp_Tc3_2 domain-containing protein [Trichonephila clavipes]
MQFRIRAHYEQLSEFERGRISGLREAEGVDNSIFQCQDGSGRPRATADREDRLVVKSAVTASASLLSTIRRAIRTQVSIMTIHRWLIDRNLRAYRALRRLPFTPVHCRARLQRCLDRAGWNHADWDV